MSITNPDGKHGKQLRALRMLIAVHCGSAHPLTAALRDAEVNDDALQYAFATFERLQAYQTQDVRDVLARDVAAEGAMTPDWPTQIAAAVARIDGIPHGRNWVGPFHAEIINLMQAAKTEAERHDIEVAAAALFWSRSRTREYGEGRLHNILAEAKRPAGSLPSNGSTHAVALSRAPMATTPRAAMRLDIELKVKKLQLDGPRRDLATSQR